MKDATAETRQPKTAGQCGSRFNAPSPEGDELIEYACSRSDREEHGDEERPHYSGSGYDWTTAEESRRAS